MSYIGKAPTPVPLTTADLGDASVTTAKLASTARINGLAGGTAGQVAYQSAADTTAFVSGTAGQLLQSNGTSAPTFVTPTYATTGKAIAMAIVFGG